jgi:hypothetical protein
MVERSTRIHTVDRALCLDHCQQMGLHQSDRWN